MSRCRSLVQLKLEVEMCNHTAIGLRIDVRHTKGKKIQVAIYVRKLGLFQPHMVETKPSAGISIHRWCSCLFVACIGLYKPADPRMMRKRYN
jgi:hypothetical protein